MTPEWSPDAEAFFGAIEAVVTTAWPLIVALVGIVVIRRFTSF